MLNNFNRDLEIVDGIETNNLRILYYDFSEKYSGKYKSYENNRLCTIIEGEKHVAINKDKEFIYNKNEFVLLAPNSTVEMDILIPTKALVFELNSELIKNVTNKVTIDYEIENVSINGNELFLGKENEGLKDCMSKIMNVFTQPNKNIEFLVDLYSQELVYDLIQIKGVTQILNVETHHPIHQAIKFMKENYASPISIKEISMNLNMSEANFSNSFKKIIGITPKEYLTNLRILSAKDMLKEKTVTEVAYDLGYENISHFINLFKTKYGITPKQYQKLHNF